MPIVSVEVGNQKNSVNNLQTIKDGTYVCKIMNCQLRQNDKGKYLDWTLKTREGQQFRYFTPVMSDGAWKLKNLIIAAGIENFEGGSFDTDLLIGKVVLCHLGNRTYQKDGMAKTGIQVKGLARYQAQKEMSQTKPIEQFAQFDACNDIPF